jgi:CheY-like chemotaxis protein
LLVGQYGLRHKPASHHSLVDEDFNNLLTIISGGAETLQRLVPGTGGADEDRIRRALGMIQQGSERAATLTHRLLAFARQQALDPRPVDANKLVTSTSELLHRTLGESISIDTVIAGSLWRTSTDPNQLENALLNLAVNARDAMPRGGRLIIETANAHLDHAYAVQQPEVTPGQYVMIAVSDTGDGMSRETMERVFEPFFTTKEPGQGTGLGLSQVYGFIKQSNGHIKIYSELGRGTVVKLYLPRLYDDVRDDPVQAVESDMPHRGDGQLILVVEDDEAVRTYSTDTLREFVYRVITAPDARTALELLARHPDIRLLFTDIGLPGGMNGRQAAELARQQRPDLMVLFTTGYAGNAVVHGGMLDPGMNCSQNPSPMPRWAQRSGPYWAVEIRMTHAIIGRRWREALPRIRLAQGSSDGGDCGMPDATLPASQDASKREPRLRAIVCERCCPPCHCRRKTFHLNRHRRRNRRRLANCRRRRNPLRRFLRLARECRQIHRQSPLSPRGVAHLSVDRTCHPARARPQTAPHRLRRPVPLDR